jgi:hypothetical protein
LIDGMPRDVSFQVTAAWHGSAGSVYYAVAANKYPANVTDLGAGLSCATPGAARAEKGAEKGDILLF